MHHENIHNNKFVIEAGYEVRDVTGDVLGTVKEVFYADAQDMSAPEPPVVAPPPVQDVFTAPLATPYGVMFNNLPDFPEEHRQHFYSNGFIRIGRGLLQSDLLAPMDRISHVSDECVHLTVTKDDLFRV